ncbi:MAG: SGNH/GDSL hydrolase family protein [Kiritimatiellia bacterium]
MDKKTTLIGLHMPGGGGFRRAWRLLVRAGAVGLAAVVGLELFSFAAISGSNYLIYGSAFEGSRARYDAHALFLAKDGRRATAFNETSGDPARDRVIWMFGGSTLRGSTDDDRRTVPSIVSRELNRSATNGLRYTVVNFGVNSFNSLLEIKYLQKALIEEDRAPDMVVFYDGANDCTYYSQYRTPYGHHGYRRVRALVESYRNRPLGLLKPLWAAACASFTKELHDKLSSLTDVLAPDDPGLMEYLDLTQKRYRHVGVVAGAYGADFAVFWQPLQWVETGDVGKEIREAERDYVLDSDRFSTLKKNIDTVYGGVENRLRGQSYFIPFRNVLCGRGQAVYRADGVHLEDAGREMVGVAMADALRDRLDAAHPREP